MNSISTGHNGTNFRRDAMTMLGTFLSNNWYLVVMVIFGLVHVYIAWQRNTRDTEKSDLEIAALKAALNKAS